MTGFRCNDARTVRQLVEAGADVTVTDGYGHTPLHMACVGDTDVTAKAQFLLERCGDGDAAAAASLVDVTDGDGCTALNFAVGYDRLDVATMLVDVYAASVHHADIHGNTCLHSAAIFGYMDMVKLLTSRPQCDVNHKNEDGKTSADFAKEFGHTGVADYLTGLSELQRQQAT